MSKILTPLERRARLKSAVTLHELTMEQAAEKLGVSYNHLTLVLKGERRGSRRLEIAVATFLGLSHEQVFAVRSRTDEKSPV